MFRRSLRRRFDDMDIIDTLIEGVYMNPQKFINKGDDRGGALAKVLIAGAAHTPPPSPHHLPLSPLCLSHHSVHPSPLPTPHHPADMARSHSEVRDMLDLVNPERSDIKNPYVLGVAIDRVCAKLTDSSLKGLVAQLRKLRSAVNGTKITPSQARTICDKIHFGLSCAGIIIG
jgi:hypothetical protein